MDGDDDDAVARVVSELESLDQDDSSTGDALPFSEAALSGLAALASPLLWDALAARGLPASALLRPLSASMDSSSTIPSLLASRAFLSLLLLPSAPIFSLFSPLPLLSLFRSLRRPLKSPLNASSHPKKRKAAAPHDDGDVSRLLAEVLRLLLSVLAHVRLDAVHDGLKPLVDTIASILSSPLAAAHLRIADASLDVLYSVVSRPEHGEQLLSSVEVLKSLAAILLSPGKSPARAAAMEFVARRMAPLGREVEAVRKALVYLPRFLAVKAPERAEPRAGAVDAILEVVRTMPMQDQVGFVEYVVKMAQGKARLRLLACDLILALLTSLPDPLGTEDVELDACNSWGIKCLEALLRRCSDSTGGIRARALTNMAQVVAFLSRDARNVDSLRENMGFRTASFNELLRKRCLDEKAAVRKAALVLIMRSTALIGKPIDEMVLKMMGSACSDPLVSIRKAAVAALSEVYRQFGEERVINEWLHAVPPLIVDNETSIQEECENLFLELVLDQISRAGNTSFTCDATYLESLFPEGALILLKGLCDGEVEPCIRKICANLGKKKKVKASIARSLQNIIATSESLWLKSSRPIEKWTAPPGAWQLLSEVSSFTPKAVDWKFLHHHWELLDKESGEAKGEILDDVEPNLATWAGDRVSLLQTISNVSMELPPEPAADLAHNLLRRIEDFNMHLSEVDAHVKALKTLCKRKATNPEECNSLVLKWVCQLLAKALKIIDNYLKEVSEACKSKNFFTPPQGRRTGKTEVPTSESTLGVVTAVFTVGSLIMICPSADLQGIIPLLHTIITSGNYDSKPKKLVDLTISVKEMAPSLYIQSWVTMGKICLVDDKLAKRYIPLFVQELERSDCAALRNNIMVVMADFCVRYTALVDCYIPKITTSLRDPCEVVRRQTFVLLSRLLQRDYVKWKGVLFLRFLLSLVDESEKIRRLADFLFGNILKVKAPLLAYNSFVEAIFVLNDCHAHPGYSETHADLHAGPRIFSIRGNDEKAKSQRMHIYVSLLKQMAPEHLLATSAKLCAEILAVASDGLLNIDDVTGQSVLQDALQILACKEMRIHPTRGYEATDMDDDCGESGGSGVLVAARGRAVTQVAKKNLIQIAVPIFIELKRLLESKNSPLTGSLMECLRALLKDYKNEIDEILVADKQLQKELLYDMQKYEAAKAKSTVAEAVATVHRSESYRSPNGQTSNGNIYATVREKLGTENKMSSAVADAAARARARSVLKEVNQNILTPPLHAMSVPKLKQTTDNGRVTGDSRPSTVLESLRRRQSFESDDEK